jgi:hypothetical protein
MAIFVPDEPTPPIHESIMLMKMLLILRFTCVFVGETPHQRQVGASSHGCVDWEQNAAQNIRPCGSWGALWVAIKSVGTDFSAHRSLCGSET